MRITHKIDMLTRVEGHGSVKLVQDGKRVVDARLDLTESPRLFEALLVGRRFDEIADIACRICSICSTVHKVSALQAVETAMGITVSPQTGLLRELAVQGGQIESHALHVFCLALPDYLGLSDIHELAAHEPEKLQMGLRIKKIGNLIQEVIGGRAIHPFNLMVGGVGKVPTADQLRNLREQLDRVCADIEVSMNYVMGMDDVLPGLAILPACAVSGGPPLFGDHLVTLTETILARLAAVWLNEQTETNTHAKISRFGDAPPFMVGPLARVTLAMPSGYATYFANASIAASIKARVVELKQAVEQSLRLIDLLIDGGLINELPVFGLPREGEGASLMEAPRGVLVHSYQFDVLGKCTVADIITPTAINQAAMSVSLKELIVAMDGAGYDEIKRAAEILVRCYDPCISCAVH